MILAVYKNMYLCLYVCMFLIFILLKEVGKYYYVPSGLDGLPEYVGLGWIEAEPSLGITLRGEDLAECAKNLTIYYFPKHRIQDNYQNKANHFRKILNFSIQLEESNIKSDYMNKIHKRVFQQKRNRVFITLRNNTKWN